MTLSGRRRGWRGGLLAVAAAVAIAAGAAQAPAPAVVTILHFNDAHEMDATDGGRSGGMARIETLATRLRKTTPALLFTMGGDFLSPAAIGTARVNGEPLAGRQAVAVLNLMGVQWTTLGNHEFDIPEAAFRQRLGEATFGIVSTNVVDANDRPFEHTVKSTIVPVKAGGRTIRVGLIGLTIDFNKKPWVKYLPPIDTAREQIAAMKGKTDAIVALTHLGLPGDQALVTALPEIDLVLGGHEHENYQLRRGPHATVIAKADANGKSAVVATLTFAAAGGRPAVATRIDAMDDSIPRDARVQAEVDRWMALGFAAFRADGLDPNAPVATLTEPLDGRESTVRNRPGALTDLVLAAMVREVKTADVAILNGGSIRIDDVLQPGMVRQYDVIRILPFGGKVLRATFDGALLAQVLDAGQANQGIGGYLQTWGVSQQDGRWIVNGRPIDPAVQYSVALPEFLLTGGETRLSFLTRTHPQVHDVQEFRDVRQAVIDELKARYR